MRTCRKVNGKCRGQAPARVQTLRELARPTSPACECFSELFASAVLPQLLNARRHLARGLSNLTFAGSNASGSKSPPSQVIMLSYSGSLGSNITESSLRFHALDNRSERFMRCLQPLLEPFELLRPRAFIQEVGVLPRLETAHRTTQRATGLSKHSSITNCRTRSSAIRRNERTKSR